MAKKSSSWSQECRDFCIPVTQIQLTAGQSSLLADATEPVKVLEGSADSLSQLLLHPAQGAEHRAVTDSHHSFAQ